MSTKYLNIQDMAYTDNPFLKKQKPKRQRNLQDNYPTPPKLSGAIAEYLITNYFKGNKFIDIIEPSCGEGNLIKALRFHAGPQAQIHGYDIRDVGLIKEATFVDKIDWLTIQGLGKYGHNLIVTNPPYSIANKFILHTLEIAQPETVCAFLLRLSFLYGKERQKLIYDKYPPYELVPLTPRPSFTNDKKTDASEYALFIWVCGHEGSGMVSKPLVWD